MRLIRECTVGQPQYGRVSRLEFDQTVYSGATRVQLFESSPKKCIMGQPQYKSFEVMMMAESKIQKKRGLKI